jgi:monoamine oxidase
VNHFGGEHTAPEDQGFLSGGVVSGEPAAAEVQQQV